MGKAGDRRGERGRLGVRRLAFVPFAAALLATVSSAAGWACVAMASLEVAPAVVEPGQEVAFRGAFFHDLAPVILRWESLDGPVLATVPPETLIDAGHGSWREMEGSFSIPANAATGERVVIATQDYAPGRSTWGVPARAVVRVGGSEPGGYSGRHQSSERLPVLMVNDRSVPLSAAALIAAGAFALTVALGGAWGRIARAPGSR